MLNNFILSLSDIIWGIPMIIILLGTGIFLSILTKFIQIRGFYRGIELISGKYDSHKDKGEITHFQALATALSATIGTGNIAGVATAIVSGGPGALFWMWISAFFGMAIKFSSATLSMKYRKENNGSFAGGPMYYIEKGLKEKFGISFKWLALFFAISTAIAAFGIGNMAQSNSVSSVLNDLILSSTKSKIIFQAGTISITNSLLIKGIIGIILAILTGTVIIGGIKKISKFTSKLMPFMAAIYLITGLIIIFINLPEIGRIFKIIFIEAFHPKAVGGAILGSTILYTMRMGFARGIFSNEAGLGTAPIVHGAAKTNEPVREGLVAMLGPFIDTIVICTFTGLIIILSGLYTNGSLNGAALTSNAFEKFLPSYGKIIVSISLILFSYSTLIGWYYYGEKAIEYIIPSSKIIKSYQILWLLLIFIGAIAKLSIVWNISDIFNGLMALPNIIALLLLSPIIIKELNNYLKREKL